MGDATYLQKSFDEVFAFDRTVSRLMEMQSVAYLSEAPGGGSGSARSGTSSGGQSGRRVDSQAGSSSSSYNTSVPEAGRDALAAALEQAVLADGLAVEHQV